MFYVCECKAFILILRFCSPARTDFATIHLPHILKVYDLTVSKSNNRLIIKANLIGTFYNLLATLININLTVYPEALHVRKGSHELNANSFKCCRLHSNNFH